ncbi:NAD(P)-dependent oxidoreductase [Alphaproteobacteria bacterium]|jgi:D-3-phosphoglycerate dehydrogenase|nr:NAD(P)-dependent oxidoreductase [Alphaproteobacteria bacterium]
MQKNICYFEVLTNPEAFEQTLTQDGDITLTRLEHAMPSDEIRNVLRETNGYQIRGNWRDVPEEYLGHRALIEQSPNLLAISTGGAGYDTINVADCTEAGVLVVSQAGMNAEAVSEHAVAMMLSLTKKIAQVNQALRRDRNWVRRDYMNNDIHGKRLGIVGLGQIGARTAEICRLAFGMDIIAYHPRIDAEEATRRGARLVGFNELLEQSDFVLVACGLNDETRGMFATEAFARMKQSAYFITIGRGGIHDEDALAKALSANEIAGAGLDVWMEEPPPLGHPLLEFDNVFASPHIAAITPESALKSMTGAAEQWRAILSGQRPPRLANAPVWPAYKERYKRIMGAPVTAE